MAAQYPSNLVTTTQLPDTRTDSTATPTNHAADHNNAADEIIAIEAELGINPSSTYADVVTRLDSGFHNTALDIYNAFNTLGGLSGPVGFPAAYTIDPEDADNDLAPGNNELRGAAFMVKRSWSTSAMGFNVTAVATGTGSNYIGGALFSVDSGGNWVFIANTGATQGNSFVNATGGVGWKTMNWRNSADTANQSYALVPGTIYIVGVIVGSWTTSTPKILGFQSAAAGSNTGPNFGTGVGNFYRTATASGRTAKITANIAPGSLTPVAFLPLLTLY